MARFSSPLRYPGGKQRLAPFIAELIEANGLIGGHYAEPYAGGAGVALDLLLSGRVSQIHLNDLSLQIYAFWQSVTSSPDEFCRRIASASLSVDDWKVHREVVRNPKDHDLFELGFSTFYLNRCNRSGVLTGGVIGGLEQKGRWGIDARFPRNELIRRVEVIATKADQISVTNMDAEDFMLRHAPISMPANSLVYCDPPYYEQAKGLYLNWYEPSDHARLADIIQKNLILPWVVSYDGHPSVVALYNERRRFLYPLQYSASRNYKGREVLIFSDDLELPSESGIPAIHDALVAATAQGLEFVRGNRGG